MVRLLLAAGAEVNAVAYNLTALAVASRNGHGAVVCAILHISGAFAPGSSADQSGEGIVQQCCWMDGWKHHSAAGIIVNSGRGLISISGPPSPESGHEECMGWEWNNV